MDTSDKESPMKEAGTKARHVSDEVKHQTRESMHSATEQGKSMLEERKRSAAHEVGGVASALHKTAEQLEKQDQASMARMTHMAADALDDWSHTLGDRDINSLVNEVTDFARRQPVVFLGTAVAAGFLLSRFLKSSSPERVGFGYESSHGYGESSYQGRSRHSGDGMDETPEILKPSDSSVEVKGDLL